MTGNKFLDYILGGLSILMTVIAVSYFAYTNLLYERPIVDNEAEFKSLMADSSEVQVKNSFEIKRLIVNLHSRSTKLRFIEMNLHLVPFKAKDLSVIEKFTPQIKDVLIDTTSRMSAEEVNSVAGRILLENRAKKAINEQIGKPVVKQILFSKFTVQ